MADIELGIYVDPYASTRAQRKANEVTKCAKTSIELTPLFTKRAIELPREILVAGGDGSIHKVIQHMVDSNQVRPIGLLGGGTNNALYTSLWLGGHAMFASDFLTYRSDKRSFSSADMIRPGLIGGQIFIIDVGLGNFEQNVGQANKRLNGYSPRAVKVPIACLVGLTQTLLARQHETTPLDTFSVSPRIGKRLVFPSQTHQSDLITHAWIDEKSEAAKAMALLKTAVYWQFGNGKQPDCMKLDQAERFEVISSGRLRIDGDLMPQTEPDTLVVRRWENAIPIVAIDY